MNKEQYKKTKLPVWLLVLIAFAVFCNAVAATGNKTQIKEDASIKARLVDGYGKLPLSFEANMGQTDKKVKFISRGPGYGLFLTPTEAVLSLYKSKSGESKNDKSSERALPAQAEKMTLKADQSKQNNAATLRMKLVGSNPNPQINGLDELPGKVNYLKGNDPKLWRTGVATTVG